MDNTTAIILAAGLGKRMNDPETPKVLFKLKDKPLLGYVVDVINEVNNKSKKYVINKSVFVVGHHKEKVISFVNEYYKLDGIGNVNGNDNISEAGPKTTVLKTNRFDFAIQNEQLGTGHAVNQAKDFFGDNTDGNILILCGDVPFLTSDTILKFLMEHKGSNSDISVLSTIAQNPKGYGRIVRDAAKNFKEITEEKDADELTKEITEVNSGIYYLKSSLLFDLLKDVKSNNAQGEYYLTDIIGLAINKSQKVFAFPLAKFEELQGINTKEELLNAEKLLD